VRGCPVPELALPDGGEPVQGAEGTHRGAAGKALRNGAGAVCSPASQDAPPAELATNLAWSKSDSAGSDAEGEI
jgi:hypothetical protein